MQKRKGFTLVELVIVIAVIAILAGVLIGTFASVINKANESARMQEMKAAEHDKKAEDILNKLNNAEWFGWEDLETKIGAAVQEAVKANANANITTKDLDATKVAIINAVDQAVAKYAASAGQGNSNLTADEVKYIVEQAVSKSGGVTEAQVRAIVNQAATTVTGIQLTAAQIQRIADAAVNKVTASGLTSADVAKVVTTVVEGLSKEATVSVIDAKIDGAITTINDIKASASTLTEKEVADIVSKYINTKTGVVKGDYTWFTGETVMKMPATEAALQALSVLSQTGETFEGQTIQLEANQEIVMEDKWIPVKVFEGTLDGSNCTIKKLDMDIIYWATEESGSTGTVYQVGENSYKNWYGERKSYGFINVLGNDSCVKNLTLEWELDEDVDPNIKYASTGGVIGAVTGSVTLENVTVKGTISSYMLTSGFIGTISVPGGTSNTTEYTVSIKNCKNEANITSKFSSVCHENTSDTAKCCAAALIGEAVEYAHLVTLDVDSFTNTGTITAPKLTNDKALQGTIVGRLTNVPGTATNCSGEQVGYMNGTDHADGSYLISITNSASAASFEITL